MAVEFDEKTNEIRTTRPLRRSGNSVVVSIPPELLRHARMQVGDEVTVAADLDDGRIEIRKSSRSTADIEEATAEN